MKDVSQRVRNTRQVDLVNFIHQPNYESFIKLVKSNVSYEQVMDALGGYQVGAGKVFIKDQLGGEVDNRYRYFETYDEWDWFDIYHFTNHDLWLFSKAVYRQLYIPRKRQEVYSVMNEMSKGAIYLTQRYMNAEEEDFYTYWMLYDILQIPASVLNQVSIPKHQSLTFNVDYFDFQKSGVSVARNLLQSVKEKQRDKDLNEDWQDWLTYIEEGLRQAIKDIKSDERYKNRFLRGLDVFVSLFRWDQESDGPH